MNPGKSALTNLNHLAVYYNYFISMDLFYMYLAKCVFYNVWFKNFQQQLGLLVKHNRQSLKNEKNTVPYLIKFRIIK